MNSPTLIDKTRVRISFDKAAGSYDEAAVLQREVADRLLERLDLITLQPSAILDVGAGTGYCTRGLAKRYKKASIVSLDLAPAMLREARARLGVLDRWRGRYRFVCGDAEGLPLADDRFDMVVSSLALQWCQDPEVVFREFLRVLKPGGFLVFATFGPDTLKELRTAWSRVDGQVHVSAFPDMHDLGDALIHSRYADPVMAAERFTLTYTDAYGLMRDLKQLGAHNASQGRPHGLTAKGRLRAMVAAYEQYRREGVLPASYEVVYGHAWAPEVKTVGDTLGDGLVKIPVSAIGKRP